MEKLSGNEIRKMFIEYFNKTHNSTVVPSSSLVPNNPTVLLTTAGMLQFVPIFLGLETPPYDPPRAVSCQKCARAGGKDSDIENVGKTPRHHTFFEMLGNFSFGDYFKSEVIPWAWEFVTQYLKLDPNRLYITVYEHDDEAYNIWKNDVKIPEDRIFRKGKKDNFWGPPGPTGPCGPCTEIHFDLGEQYKCCENCSVVNCECDRWVEIWNLVFMELFSDENGNLTPLEKKNVDTGMGLERIAMVCQNKASTFETDLLMPILNKVEKIANVKYKENNKIDISLRVITDHIRCCVFMIDDGILPGNEGRSYVLRMILRRALRHMRLLNIEIPSLYKLTSCVIDLYKDAYPSLEKNAQKIEKTILDEEKKFQATINRGEKLLEELIKNSGTKISGEDAFKLYDTFGFPLELTIEIAKEYNIEVDVEGFREKMKIQKKLARESAQRVILTDDLVYVDIEKKYGNTLFLGYEKTLISDSKVIDIVEPKIESEDNIIDIILDKTPFYALCGGQGSDEGIISNRHFQGEVITVFKVNKLIVHRTKVLSGEIKIGDIVECEVNIQKREKTSYHHTLAHLLQASLIEVLGNEVKQKGSQVDENRTRFDFSYPKALTKDEIKKVENKINIWINNNLKQETEVMNIEDAKKQGAIHLFDEKYDQNVRVVKIGNISKELCGGTHAKTTSQLKHVKIISESAISSGVRRIEIICCDSCINYIKNKAEILDNLSETLKCKDFEVLDRITKILDENQSLKIHLNKIESEITKEKIFKLKDNYEEFKNGKLISAYIDNINTKYLKSSVERLIDAIKDEYIIIIGGKSNECKSVNLFVAVSNGYIKNYNIDASSIIKKLTQKLKGKGGGRANFAQGSVEFSENIENQFNSVKFMLE